MRTAVPAVALVLALLPSGPVLAAPTGGNEFLDMDLAQLMNITVTSRRSPANTSSPCSSNRAAKAGSTYVPNAA